MQLFKSLMRVAVPVLRRQFAKFLYIIMIAVKLLWSRYKIYIVVMGMCAYLGSSVGIAAFGGAHAGTLYFAALGGVIMWLWNRNKKKA